MTHRRTLRLSAPATPDGVVRILSDTVSLAEGQTESWETLTRVVTFKDPFYGKVQITADTLGSFIRNFQANVYGQDLAIDLAHNPSDGAAGFIRALEQQDGRLRGRIEWTPKGIKAVREDGFRYFSVEYNENWENPETGEEHGPTLFGAALTTRPRVKRLDPIDPSRLQLSLDGEDQAAPALSPYLARKLSKEIADVKDKYLRLFSDALGKIKALGDGLRQQFSTQFAAALDGITDEAQAQILLSAFSATAESTAKQLGEAAGSGTVKLDFGGLQQALAGTRGLSEDDVRRLMAEQAKASADAAAAAKADQDRLLKVFADAVGAHEGLSDALREKLLAEAAELITPALSEDQVKRLAQSQLALADEVSAAQRLRALGYPAPRGSVHISVDDSNSIKSLQETVDRRLGLADMPGHQRYNATGGQLQDLNKRFAEKVLAQFDAERGAQLHHEHKMLSGGAGNLGDVAVPATFERTVIREALYNLVGLNFVNMDTAEFAASHLIPYSYRDTTGAGRGDTRVYEGGSIPRAGVIQTSETAYPLPQKIAFQVSDELRYLTSTNRLNWDAVSENQANASRIIREDTEQLIFNEILRASDEFGAVAVSNENLELQADGTKTVFVTAQFPVVRPRATYDLQGNQVGSTVNPITVSYNSAALAEYDGTGTQANGTYYVLDYNLGEIHLVNQAGAVQTPADGTAYTISYSYATNVAKFDTDLGSNELDVHWNTFLYRYGLRKSVIEDDRYHMANFGLMSGSLRTAVEQAKTFAANFARAGTDLAADGNLGRIKDVPNFKTSAPGLHMGDVRAVIGERGQTRLRMMKPWMMGELENQRDANGRFTGQKEAYGDQFVILHTPSQLKRAYTSIVTYSATGRVAR